MALNLVVSRSQTARAAIPTEYKQLTVNTSEVEKTLNASAKDATGFSFRGWCPLWCHAKGMTDYFYEHKLRIFDYPEWAEPLRDGALRELQALA